VGGVLLIASCFAFPASALDQVTLGITPTAQSAAAFYALDHGYFRDAGIDLKTETIVRNSDTVMLVTTARLDVAEAGIAAGVFNALATDAPIIMAMERGGSPIYHELLIRPNLVDTIKTVADLKGRPVALVGPGTILDYEMSKVLASAGLTLKDIDSKYLDFDKMGVALENGAVDAALEVPPFPTIVIGQGMGKHFLDTDDYVRPTPYETNAYLANTDWIKEKPDVAQRFFVALVRGARQYCQAYHGDMALRNEMLDLLVKYKVTTNRDLLARAPWQARDPNGRFNMASILDIQDWFLKNGVIGKAFPADRLVDPRFAEAAAKELGPFEVTNKDSKLPGCR
jgi:NitT/TauT family transport system substrate-binding protein